jgi:hypothetical protein
MATIQATVNTRLLTKASRLFTGTLQGRVIEILQNARRAGATEVTITNQVPGTESQEQQGLVTIHDNGRGIDDFAKLLDLGGSGWDEALEASEDPAGVGIFCLAPRRVTIRSQGKMVAIEGTGWTGSPVEIRDDAEPVQGTVLCFEDEPWNTAAVERHAVYTGMQVTVDGQACPKESFVSDRVTAYPELGCRIEVRESPDLDAWHRSCAPGGHYCDNVLVSFHGQIVALCHHPIEEHALHYLIEMTGEATGIRLMLPARTCLVENEAFESLKQALELEAFRYLQRRGHHRLPYQAYLRARELGVELPEAEPTYQIGLLGCCDAPEPVKVVMPDGFSLDQCYRLDPHSEGDESDEVNLHLLAALGKFERPFVPVEIRSCYDGYSWAKLPMIGKVKVSVGKLIHEDCLGSGELTCVRALTITAHASDGQIFSSPACMAMAAEPSKDSPEWATDCVLVTPKAEGRLSPSEIWHHLGGWSDEGDTYATQAFDFEQELNRFWADVVGPDEHLRQSILACLAAIRPKWSSVTISAKGIVTIRRKNGSRKILKPPQRA